MTTSPDRDVVAAARPEAMRWAGLDVVPSGPKARLGGPVARRLFLGAVSRLDVTVECEGRTYGKGGPVMRIHRPDEFFARIGSDQLIGFGEAYLTGVWDTPTPSGLGDFLGVLAGEISDLVPQWMQRLRGVVAKRPPKRQVSSKRNSRANIAHHYDLSNELFQLFLDPTLSYSSALFDGIPSPLDADEPLAEAQARKIERLLDVAGVAEGSRVLEIGSGWGELAMRAAKRGAQVLTITLSTEQQALARQRIAEAGLTHLVDVELCDYRDVQGSFDAIVSVEMIEAVGYDYWDTYFQTIDRVLAPGGKVGIQAITMPHDRMLATRNTWTWIHKYIFPGGFLPSVEVIDQITRERTSLRVTDRLPFGSHYAETLRRWDAAFLGNTEKVLELGFDETFIRMWHFYLEYSRAGFASGYIDVNQILLTREDVS
ncbi:cyclopropane-fatty-acyl-phospholipid synthase family protein [Nocardioides sp. TRM66260-LWL]|uniref:SAM-dependent methyltransferase n=1 Tax=Nocardioides sp. TRM66260-LWL TaxID=2874478 RepID=UPI001CC64441|nr:cyclopropane-fatty-acyl-phospholipid synthase family protein [Nocardioides sp. TRM66260-LWL]MBZ5736002.1 cyclopropane-fatty-acyl-phospholipid synthase family protein [Nocardioides sp. TRM66260-LWL]